MYNKEKKGEEYIRKFPKFKKWINECPLCHRKGYDPKLPLKITKIDGSLEIHFIKKYFDQLALDENGICEKCSIVINKN